VDRPGSLSLDHTQWVLPVASSDPDSYVKQLRARGYDATQRASSLMHFADDSFPADDRWNRLVYLPHHPQVVPEALATSAAPRLGRRNKAPPAGLEGTR